jgi:hypothetical protein
VVRGSQSEISVGVSQRWKKASRKDENRKSAKDQRQSSMHANRPAPRPRPKHHQNLPNSVIIGFNSSK